MLKNLPTTPETLIAWTWPEIEPYYRELESRSITAANGNAWLADWSSIGERIEELYARLSVATSVNTADREADERMNKFLDGIFPNITAADQKLKEKLLASQVEPEGFGIPLRNMRAEADLFRASNLPLLAEQQKLAIQYDKIYGAQTVNWDGGEVTLTRLAMNGRDEQGQHKKEKVLRLEPISQTKARMRQIVWREAIEDVVKHSHEKPVLRRLEKLLAA